MASRIVTGSFVNRGDPFFSHQSVTWIMFRNIWLPIVFQKNRSNSSAFFLSPLRCTNVHIKQRCQSLEILNLETPFFSLPPWNFNAPPPPWQLKWSQLVGLYIILFWLVSWLIGIFQLLSSLHIVAEYSLPSLLKTLFKWYEKQVRQKKCLIVNIFWFCKNNYLFPAWEGHWKILRGRGRGLKEPNFQRN